MKLQIMNYPKITSLILAVTCLFFHAVVTADDELLSVSVKPLSSLLIESKQSTPASAVSLNTSVISAEITGRAFKVYEYR